MPAGFSSLVYSNQGKSFLRSLQQDLQGKQLLYRTTLAMLLSVESYDKNNHKMLKTAKREEKAEPKDERRQRDPPRPSVKVFQNVNSGSKQEKSFFEEESFKGQRVCHVKREEFQCFACMEKNTHISKCLKEVPNQGGQATSGNSSTKERSALASIVTQPYSALWTKTKGCQGVWLLDSGASDHMTSRRDLIQDFEVMSGEVYVGNGTPLKIEGKGTLKLSISDECGGYNFEFCDTLYVPELQHNLLSQGTLESKGLKIISYQGVSRILQDEEELIKAIRVGQLYYVTTKGGLQIGELKQYFDSERKASKVTISTWHSRLGHLNSALMKKIPGLEVGAFASEDCNSCSEGDMEQLRLPRVEGFKAMDILERVYSDVIGPISVPSVGGNRFFSIFVDEYSRYTTVMLMRNKNEYSECFKRYQLLAETKSGKKIREYHNQFFVDQQMFRYLRKCGIRHRPSDPLWPSTQTQSLALGPIGLRKIGNLILNTARCMIRQANLPEEFWGETITTVVYLQNLSPSAAIDGMVPMELWSGKKLDESDYEHLRVIGCQAWAHVPLPEGKFSPSTEECVHIGYEEGYVLWHLRNSVLFTSRNVTFQESIFPFKTIEKRPASREIYLRIFEASDVPREAGAHEGVISDIPGEKGDQGGAIPYVPEKDGLKGCARVEAPLRSTRSYNLDKRVCCQEPTSVEVGSDGYVSRNVQEVLRGEFSEKWWLAMEEEISNMEEQNTWEIVKRPEGQNVVESKWVFTVKGGVGNEPRFKARLVAQGLSHVEGVDFSEIYCPVVPKKTLRLLLAIAVQKSWNIEQYDIAGAYLNSPSDVTVFMEQAPGIIIDGFDRKRFVYKLNKVMYRLKQSARDWDCHLKRCLEACGFTQVVSDPSVFTGRDVKIGVYGDDLLVIGLKESLIKFKEKLGKHIKLKDLGAASRLLSINIHRDGDILTLSQKYYIETMLDNFEMGDCMDAATPFAVEQTAHNSEGCDKVPFDSLLYRSAVESLNFVANCTRPDILNAVFKVSQCRDKPTVKDWARVKSIMRYLKGTTSYTLHYSRDNKPIQIFCDADWANDEDAKSYSGYVITMGGGAVIWRSKKQDTVATSTTHAEYIAMYSTITEVDWVQDFFEEIGLSDMLRFPTEICADNLGAIALAMGNSTSDNTKHFRAKLRYVQQCVTKKRMCFRYVKSGDNISDLFTKKLPGPRVAHLSSLLGLK